MFIDTHKKGFSLLESLVSISLLALALSGIMSLSLVGVRSTERISNQIKAFFLANEAVEYMRNVRDSNVLEGSPWLDGLGDCQTPEGCYVDAPGAAIASCGALCPKIKFNSSTNLYNYVSGSDTIFTRKISITEIQPQEVKILVDISWPERGETGNFVLEEHLFNLSFE